MTGRTDTRHEAIRELTSDEIAAVSGGIGSFSFGGIGQIFCALKENLNIIVDFFSFCERR